MAQRTGAALIQPLLAQRGGHQAVQARDALQLLGAQAEQCAAEPFQLALAQPQRRRGLRAAEAAASRQRLLFVLNAKIA